jgi:hypothetical protein
MNPQKQGKWESWIDDIEQDVWQLMDRRRWNAVFERVVLANKRLLTSGLVIPEYFRHIYADYAVLAVRRLVRRDPKSISLTGLLDDLRDNHMMLTRQWYRSLYLRPLPGGETYPKDFAFHLADGTFDRFCDADRNTVSKSFIEADLANIETETGRILHFSDRVKAHKDRRGVEIDLPTYNDLHTAVEALASCAQKYVLLLTGRNTLSMLPVDQTNAIQVFNFPWIDADHPPDLKGLL